MKKKVISLGIILTLCVMVLTGCSEKTRARNFGGNASIDLEPGEKLEEVTWKDSNLWILTRPMKDGETAETYKFSEDSEFGVLEGTVTIIEHEGE